VPWGANKAPSASDLGLPHQSLGRQGNVIGPSVFIYVEGDQRRSHIVADPPSEAILIAEMHLLDQGTAHGIHFALRRLAEPRQVLFLIQVTGCGAMGCAARCRSVLLAEICQSRLVLLGVWQPWELSATSWQRAETCSRHEGTGFVETWNRCGGCLESWKKRP